MMVMMWTIYVQTQSDSYTVGALYTVMDKILRTSMYLNVV